MASLYILHSQKLNKFYIGSCNDFSIRIKQHLSKEYKGSFTAAADDWELYFYYEGINYHLSRKIERHIKAMKSKKYIKNLKKYPDILTKLIEEFQ